MTGFGREQAVINGREIIAEIRSVNHKFFEFSSKLPRNYQYLEPKLKTMLKEKITRGKVELSLLVYNIDVKDTSVKVNEQVASQYIEAIRTIAPDLGITDSAPQPARLSTSAAAAANAPSRCIQFRFIIFVLSIMQLYFSPKMPLSYHHPAGPVNIFR